MYKHYDTDDESISLHDCRATKILYENGVLTFVFPDGIWITQDHPGNTTGRVLRTDRAEVQFHLELGNESDITLYVFREKWKKTVREEWPLTKLMEGVNSGKYTLEFLYQYKGYHARIIECCLWSEQKPYHRECEIKLSLKGMTYGWNRLCEDKEW